MASKSLVHEDAFGYLKVICQAYHYREEAFMKETNSSPQP